MTTRSAPPEDRVMVLCPLGNPGSQVVDDCAPAGAAAMTAHARTATMAHARLTHGTTVRRGWNMGSPLTPVRMRAGAARRARLPGRRLRHRRPGDRLTCRRH